MTSVRVLLATGTLLASTVAFAAPTPIQLTTCGQVVPKGTVAFLAADLDCTGNPNAVVLGNNARLLLGGFTLQGANNAVVQCDQSCRIVGPGSIVGGADAVAATKRAQVRAVTISGATIGLNVGIAIVEDSLITGNVRGIQAQRTARVKDSQIVGNSDFGVIGYQVALRGVTVSGGEVGVSSTSTTLTDSSIDTTTDGGGDVDIRSIKRPGLRRSTCAGRSQQHPNVGDSWGICALD